MKLMAIERALQQHPGLDWDSPEVKVLDHLYSSLGDDGLFRAYQASGFTEQLVSPQRIAHFAANPPADTRAWTRAKLLQRASAANVEVESVDWDRMTFRIRGRYAWPSYRTLEMADPFGLTQAQAQPIFDNCTDFGDLLDGLESLSTANESLSDAIAVN
jgi:proteasome accessory factor A